LETLMKVTAPKGRILFSSNFEKWTFNDFATRAAKVLASPAGRGWRLETTPSPDWDFELPREQYGNLMKSFFLARD
jgi:23S rRNA G2069 N7-methylase RlmK/C1962 C5-methylase RlmI